MDSDFEVIQSDFSAVRFFSGDPIENLRIRVLVKRVPREFRKIKASQKRLQFEKSRKPVDQPTVEQSEKDEQGANQF